MNWTMSYLLKDGAIDNHQYVLPQQTLFSHRRKFLLFTIGYFICHVINDCGISFKGESSLKEKKNHIDNFRFKT
jgi:uncharacterized metal-binding protein